MTEVIVEALNNKGAALDLVGRWREGTLLLEGAFKYADDSVSPELRLRVMNNLASLLDSDNPLRSAEILTEAIELARRWGVRGSFNWMINHYVNVTAYLALNWDYNVELLEQALEEATDDADRSTLLGALLAYDVIRGEDIGQRMETWQRLSAGKDQTDIDNNADWLRGWAAWGKGDGETAWSEFLRAYERQPLEGGSVVELLHASVVVGDSDRIREAVARVEQFPGTGRVPMAIRAWARAALATLDNRSRDAIAGFLDADRRFADVGGEWLRAEMAIDAVLLLPNEQQIQPLADSAEQTFQRLLLLPNEQQIQPLADSAEQTFQRLRAEPFLAQLKAARARAPEAKREPAGPSPEVALAAERESY
jgi:hypothetical protein